MPYLQTAGTHSCAIMSIGCLKDNARADNETYKTTGFVEETDGHSVEEFYSKTLYPLQQNLGRTRILPFTKLMEDIKAHYGLCDKMVLASLNEEQYLMGNQYWHKEFKKWGFRLVRKTANSTMSGAVNYLYIRNPNHVPIEKGER